MNKELTEAEIIAISDEAAKIFPVYDEDSPEFERMQYHRQHGYIAALTAERQRSKELVEALDEISIDHYPESVFKPMSEDEWAKFVRYVQREYVIDAISGHYGRFFHKIHREIAQTALSNYQNKTP